MKSFFYSIRLELLKLKKTAAFWLSILGALFIPAIQMLICTARPEIFVPKIQPAPWTVFFHACWKHEATVILPLFVILLNTLVLQVEYKNNAWKQVYATPKSYIEILFSKFIVVQFFTGLSILLFSVAIIMSGQAIQMINHSYGFASDKILTGMFTREAAWMFIAVLPISVLQFGLSIHYKNFIVPLGIGLVFWITGLVIMDWENIQLYPYFYTALLFFNSAPGQMDQHAMILTNAIAWSAILIIPVVLIHLYRPVR
jgi:hypothetical protein